LWHFLKSVLVWAAMALAWYLVLVGVAGCVFNDPRTGQDCPCHTLTQCKPCPPKSESWDQENLKRNDHGCPTAIYVAPEGVLTQCPISY
jgi:hypothetical protein